MISAFSFEKRPTHVAAVKARSHDARMRPDVSRAFA
jgi:hypothetical protein